jgi:Arc/MetJ-type ribon-helix-helix transcriptional regulator
MPPLGKRLDAALQSLIKAAIRQLHLSARAYHRILKLSRTIADLAASDRIEAPTSPRPSNTDLDNCHRSSCLSKTSMWGIMWITTHIIETEMKTIQMTIDEPLLEAVDSLIAALDTTRSAFIRDALHAALRKHAITELEKAHAQGYAHHPAQSGEFDVWPAEQAWGDE